MVSTLLVLRAVVASVVIVVGVVIARRVGADARRTQTARSANQHIQPRPPKRSSRWRVADGTLLRTFSITRSNALALSPELYTMKVNLFGSHDVVFSPDGRFLAAGDAAGVTRVWGIP